MRHKTIALVLAGTALVLALAVIMTGLGFISDAMRTKGYAAEQTPPSQQGGAVVNSAAEPTAVPTATPEPTPTPTPVPTPTPEPTATPWPGPDVPEQGQPAPADYFADAAFLGNSLVTGLDYYDYNDTLAGAAFYAANSVTVLGVADYVAQMAGTQYGKIYVGLGTNEMSYDRDTLRQAFNTMIDQLEANNPGCIIYLMAVTPVSEYKSSTDRYFTRDLAKDFNSMLREIARDRHVWYLDVFTPLANENGYLPSEVTVDGVHFTPAHYEIWFNCLQTHYVNEDGTVTTPPPAEEEPAEGES